MIWRHFLCAAMTTAALPAFALTPLPPCSSVVESGMIVYDVRSLGNTTTESGFTVEGYQNATYVKNSVYVERPAPVPALSGFFGVRVTSCASGEFLAIAGENVETANASLVATEFLREDLKAGRPVTFRQVRRAAEAVFTTVVVLRETEETCACSTNYPALRPKGMTAFENRTNVD